MNTEVPSKELRILRQMRNTLGNIVKDVAPLAGQQNPLTNGTMQEIKDCFALISEREQELTGKPGPAQAKPLNTGGEQPNSSALNFVKLSKNKK